MEQSSVFSPMSPAPTSAYGSCGGQSGRSLQPAGYFDNLPAQYQASTSRPSLNRSVFSSYYGSGETSESPQAQQNGWETANQLKDECLTLWELERLRSQKTNSLTGPESSLGFKAPELERPKSQINSVDQKATRSYANSSPRIDLSSRCSSKPGGSAINSPIEPKKYANYQRPFLSPIQTKFRATNGSHHRISSNSSFQNSFNTTLIKNSPLRN